MTAAEWSTATRLLAQSTYLVLATADADGRPWATPLFFAADGHGRVLWVSSPESRHSRNLVIRPQVALTVFDSGAPIGGAEALYLRGDAGPVAAAGVADGLRALNAKLPADRQVDAADLDDSLRLYEARLAEHQILIRGGDPAYPNPVDTRLTVTPPSA